MSYFYTVSDAHENKSVCRLPLPKLVCKLKAPISACNEQPSKRTAKRRVQAAGKE